MFMNEPLIDFTIQKNREDFQRAIDLLDAKIRGGGLSAAPIIGGKEIKTSTVEPSLDPSDPSIVVGKVHFAGEAELAPTLASLSQGQTAWRRTPVATRSQILRKAAAIMRHQRNDLSALIVREAGKPWREADADVCEAIDFCDYYADEMERLGTPKLTQQVKGETNHYFYKPRGIALVISPWNFPLAIACGMVTAALVAGNCAILKPSEQTSLIAYRLAKILLEAGIPENAFAFLPGYGEVVGRGLVNSPAIDLICFTGSREVGLEIINSAAKVTAGQSSIKKVIAELGGKNAIIVDQDADLDEAIKGVLHSAFGYAGQKCSACSRLIVVGDAYEPMVSRLALAAGDITVGEAKNPATVLGPVIDETTQKRILGIIAQAEKDNKLAFKGKTPAKGYFVPATIFSDVATDKAIWREEIFGPVLSCHQAASFEEAVELANASQYALTGGVYSRSPKNIQYATQEVMVGNLYINRPCTGALVCRQPFGGFKMSGVGSKAGGPDYLIQFLEPRVVTENTMRRGFSPD